MKHFRMRHCAHGALLWWLLCVLLSAVALGMILHEVTFISKFSWKNLCVSALAESSLVLLPYLFLPPKLRPLIWLPLVALPVLAIVCLLHLRAFSVLPVGESVSLLRGMDSPTIGTALSLLRPSDILLLIIPMGELAGCMIWRREIMSCRFSASTRLIGCAFALLCAGSAMWFKYNMYERRFRMYSPNVSFPAFIHAQEHRKTDFSRTSHQLAWRGFGDYVARSFADVLLPPPSNSEEKDREIAIAIAKVSLSGILPTDVVRGIRDDRNLILIIVESWVMPSGGFPAGVNPMPRLSELMADSTAIVIRDIGIRATVGRSADGQFIYNTGLLPPRDYSFVTRNSVADYPSLAKALHVASSLEIITEPETVWNHAFTSKSYGFDRLISGLESEHDMTQDSLLVDRALLEISTLRRPFFAQLTTGTMHEPYFKPEVPAVLPKAAILAAGFTEDEYVYFERLSYTDHQIGRLIDSLRASGVADSTVIVIAADHHPTVLPQSRAFGKPRSPLVITGSGLSHIKPRHDAEQTDLFPTILDIMGATDYHHPALTRIIQEANAKAASEAETDRSKGRYEPSTPITDAPYRGVGRSLFDIAERGDTAALRAISTRAISGGTFRHR